MSGPIETPDERCVDEPRTQLWLREGRRTTVGGLPVVRVLPTKGRRTVGAWCFVDLLGPADAERPDPLEVGPHPHIGLATVTWLHAGEALHTDSLGTEQVIRPGQLNLMSAGHGIAHAELAAQPPFSGAQLWIAQPEATRHGPSRFQHLDEVPHVELPNATADVLVGELVGARSVARTDTDLLGADLELRPGTTVLELDPGYEHAIAPIDRPVLVGTEVVEPGWLALVPAGAQELVLSVRDLPGRALVLGGVPLGEPVTMWWNYVARSREEISAAYLDWSSRSERFGPVASSLPRIEAPRPPWLPAPGA